MSEAIDAIIARAQVRFKPLSAEQEDALRGLLGRVLIHDLEAAWGVIHDVGPKAMPSVGNLKRELERHEIRVSAMGDDGEPEYECICYRCCAANLPFRYALDEPKCPCCHARDLQAICIKGTFIAQERAQRYVNLYPPAKSDSPSQMSRDKVEEIMKGLVTR